MTPFTLTEPSKFAKVIPEMFLIFLPLSLKYSDIASFTMKSYNCEAVPQKLITSSIELGILS